VIDDYAVAPLYHYVTVRLLKPQFKGYAGNALGIVRTQDLHIEP
jgi:oligopeptide ABC superfamily ATP binding cassette transporter, binding protein